MRYVVDPMPVLCGETMSPAHDPENRPTFEGSRAKPSFTPATAHAVTGAASAYWIVSTPLVDEPKSPSVRNDRLKPIFCDTSLVTVSRVCENVIT